MVVVVVGITISLRHCHGKEIVVGEDMEVVIGRGGGRTVAALIEGEVDIDGIMHLFDQMHYLIESSWSGKGSWLYHFIFPCLICVNVTERCLRAVSII